MCIATSVYLSLKETCSRINHIYHFPSSLCFLQPNEDHKLPGIDTALAALHGIVQGYLAELSMPQPQIIENNEIVDVLKPDPTVRESHNVEVSCI